MATQVTLWQDKSGDIHPTENAAKRGDFIFDLAAAMPPWFAKRAQFAELLVDNFDALKAVIKQYKGNV